MEGESDLLTLNGKHSDFYGVEHKPRDMAQKTLWKTTCPFSCRLFPPFSKIMDVSATIMGVLLHKYNRDGKSEEECKAEAKQAMWHYTELPLMSSIHNDLSPRNNRSKM